MYLLYFYGLFSLADAPLQLAKGLAIKISLYANTGACTFFFLNIS